MFSANPEYPAGKTRHVNNLRQGSAGGGLNPNLRLLLMELQHSADGEHRNWESTINSVFQTLRHSRPGGWTFCHGKNLEQVFTVMTDFCRFRKTTLLPDVLTAQQVFGIGSIIPTGIWSERLQLQASLSCLFCFFTKLHIFSLREDRSSLQQGWRCSLVKLTCGAPSWRSVSALECVPSAWRLLWREAETRARLR